MTTPPKKIRAKSIGHYILGKTIGEGTFGKVKLGTHILTGEKVAVKILEKERIVDVADVERVAREIHILKLIQHPHVIQLYEIIETPRQLYLITEYCSGGELFDHIVASGRVKEREACRFFHQIIAGVEQIHRQNVVHRDLKPENLLLDDQRNIKIVDFGLSNTFQEGQLLKTACGSPCYAAPEMIAGQRYVPARCDLWSCGVILFALVCGYLPFEDQNTSTLYRKIMNADYQAPKFITDGARDLIARLLNTDPEKRYTVSQVRSHPWYRQVSESSHRLDGERGERVLEEDVLEQLDRFGFLRDYAVRCLQMNKHNHVTTTYYLLVEKKRRMVQPGDLLTGLSNACGGTAATAFEPEQLADICCTPATSPLPGDVSDPAAALLNTAADADRAGGASPAPSATGRPIRTPDGALSFGGSAAGSPNAYSHWAQALAAPAVGSARGSASGDAVPVSTPRGVVGGDGRGDASVRKGAASAEPPAAMHSAHAQSPSTPGSQAHSARGSGSQRPGSGLGTVVSSAAPSPRKRVPVQQVSRFATPRGPLYTPPLGTTPTRGGGGAQRSTTPGKRPSAGMPPTSSPSMGDPLSARTERNASSRPGTSQGIVTPQRPSGSATARSSNEARRRHFTQGTPMPESAGCGPRVSRPASPLGRPPVAASASPDIGGGMGVAGGSASSRASGPPASAWTSRHRASSASPEVNAIPSSDSAGLSMGAGALSARESRDEVMRTCRGAFNVSCTSSKAPKQIMAEIHRSLTLQRISYKQASPFLVKCQRQGLRFEMEISHLDHLESIYVVRFRRAAGELAAYKELCSKVLAEMKM